MATGQVVLLFFTALQTVLQHPDPQYLSSVEVIFPGGLLVLSETRQGQLPRGDGEDWGDGEDGGGMVRATWEPTKMGAGEPTEMQ